MTEKAIGHISQIIGSVEVRSIDGVIRVVNTGDLLHEGDVVITGQGSKAQISLNNGETLTLGEQSRVSLAEGDYQVSEYVALDVALPLVGNAQHDA